MISKSFPEIPFCLNLYKSSLCHALSNAFEMSKNIPWTSRPSSKDLQISCVMDRSWLMHESLGLKPDWLGDIKLIPVKNS